MEGPVEDESGRRRADHAVAILPQPPTATARISRTGYNRARSPGHGRVRRVLTGIGRALRARPRLFVGVAAAVLALDILVPVARPLDRPRPGRLLHLQPLAREPARATWPPGKGTLGERLGRAWDLALFWFSADGVFGIDWGFAVTAADLARFVLMGALVGAYFALWAHRRDRRPAGRRAGGCARVGRAGCWARRAACAGWPPAAAPSWAAARR